MDNCGGWAGPLWESGNLVSERGIVDLVNKDAEEGSGLVTWVGLKLGADLDDECRSDCGKETSLAA